MTGSLLRRILKRGKGGAIFSKNKTKDKDQNICTHLVFGYHAWYFQLQSIGIKKEDVMWYSTLFVLHTTSPNPCTARLTHNTRLYGRTTQCWLLALWHSWLMEPPKITTLIPYTAYYILYTAHSTNIGYIISVLYRN